MTWGDLNRILRTATEARCAELLALEQAGAARRGHLLRIHARFNKLRARRERTALVKEAIGR